MDKKYKDSTSQMVSMISTVLAVISVLLSMALLVVERWETVKIILIVLMMLMVFVLEIFLILKIRKDRYTKDDEFYRFNKLVEYSKKRKELEEEISALTMELMHSSMAEYLNVNRLVFAGQQNVKDSISMNYDSFLKQFGLVKEEIEIRKNSAVFLTPFNEEGRILFTECQRILSNIDIFLQKTDNYVDKEDIMMNIVSLIVQSEIVIVNIDGRNPNVYYELGIAHAIGKPTILISKSSFSVDDIGFDIRQKRIVMYETMEDLEKQLLYQVSRIKSKQ